MSEVTIQCRDIPWCRCGTCEITTTATEAAKIREGKKS